MKVRRRLRVSRLLYAYMIVVQTVYLGGGGERVEGGATECSVLAAFVAN